MNCSKCGIQVPAGMAFCPGCGTPLAIPGKCPNCQGSLNPGLKFCNHCGASVSAEPSRGVLSGGPSYQSGPEATGSPFPAAVETPSSPGPARPPAQSPAGTISWGSLVREIFSTWLKNLARSIPLMIIIFFAVMALHTFLLVYYNEGFNDSTWLGRQILNVQGSAISATIFWAILFGLLFGLVPAVIRKGPGGFISELFSLPGKTTSFFKESSSDGLQFFLTGIGLTLVISSFVSAMSNLALAIGIAAIFAMPVGRILAALIQSTWMTVLKALKPEQASHLARFGPLPGFVMIAGVLSGLVIGAVLPFSFYFGMLALVAAIVLIIAGKSPPATALRILFLACTCAYFLLRAQGVLADDGGWQEAGGTWSGWINSEGAIQAIIQALGPSLGAALGPSIAAAIFGIDPSYFGENTGYDNEIPDAAWDGLISSFPQLLGGPADNPYTSFQGGDGPGPCGSYGLPNYWVNTATLNLVIQDTVFAYSGLGPSVTLTQSWNADPNSRGMFGRGWRFSYESTVENTGNKIVITSGSGQKQAFSPGNSLQAGNNQPVEAVSLDGSLDRLLDYGNGWMFLKKGSKAVHWFQKMPGSAISPLNSIQDYNGNQLRLDYHPDGTLALITDAAGRVTRFEYNGKMCTSITVPDGRRASYSYDGKGSLVRAIDLMGIVTDYEYDGEGSVICMTVGRERRSVRFRYQNGKWGRQLTEVIDSAGNSIRYQMLSSNPTRVSAINREGQAFTFVSTNGLTERVEDPAGNSLGYQFSNGLPVSHTDKNGAEITMQYDQRGNLQYSTDYSGHATRKAFDANDNLVKLTNALGGAWDFSYDTRQNLIGIKTPGGKTQTMEYDASGLLVSVINSAGEKSAFAYDRFGNLVRVDFPMGNTTLLSYDEYGLTNTGRTDAAGNTTRYEYDDNGRLTRTVYPDGSCWMDGYDCCAPLFSTDENGNTVAFERDALLNITAYHDTLGNITKYRYDRNRRLIQSIDAAGRTFSYEYDQAGKLSRYSDPAGQSSTFQYDADGRLAMLQHQCGKSVAFAYDANGRIARIMDNDGHRTEFQPDGLGRLLSLTNSRGGTVEYKYDMDGQVTGKMYDGANTALYEYDAAGNMIRFSDGGGVTAYEYDAAHKVRAVKYNDASAILFSYDAAGRLVSAAYPGNITVQYDYDVRNRLTRMSWGQHYLVFEYDPAGILKREHRSNGTSSSYTANAAGLLTRLQHAHGDRAFIDLVYARDVLGNIIEEKGLRCLNAHSGAGKPFVVQAAYNRLNQLRTWNADACSYDADGNLATIAGSRQFRADYDHENRLINMHRGGRAVTCTYNGINQRVKVEDVDRTRNYHYSPDGLLLYTTDAGGQIVSRFLYSGRRLSAMIDAQGNSYFYHFSHNGSTLTITGENGEIVEFYDYSPYGEVLQSAGSGIENPFTFVGALGVIDEGEGLYFMKSRYYDAITRRFCSKDPLGVRGGFNLYSYAGNNPVNAIDPAGTDPVITPTALLWAAACLSLVFVAAHDAGTNFGEKNPVKETFDVAKDLDPKKTMSVIQGRDLKYEFFNDPEHGLLQTILTTGDKIASANPIFGPYYSMWVGSKKLVFDFNRDTNYLAICDMGEVLRPPFGPTVGFLNDLDDCVRPRLKPKQ